MCGLRVLPSVVAHTIAVPLTQWSRAPAVEVVPSPRHPTRRHSVFTIISVRAGEIVHEALVLELSCWRVEYDPILWLKVSCYIYGPLRYLVGLIYTIYTSRLRNPLLGARRRCTYEVVVLRVVGL